MVENQKPQEIVEEDYELKCNFCGEDEHEPDANYCRICGNKLI